MCSTMAIAQSHRFIYEYKYIPNIKAKDDVKKDMMALDINEKGSVYQSLDKMKNDSILRAQVEALSKNMSGTINLQGMNRSKSIVNYKVTKEYPSYTVFLHEKVDANNYKISEDKKPEWKISSETQTINGYNTQKASTHFGGRDWTAWFTTELPFPDGPYKFYGLPGLIVKLEDSTGSHIMTLVANRKQDKAEDNTRTTFERKEIAVTSNQFKKAWKDFLADPGKEIRGMGTSSSAKVYFRDASGKTMDQKDIVKGKEAMVKKILETENNRIEPSLYE